MPKVSLASNQGRLMRNNSKYIILYLCLIAALLGTVMQLAEAQTLTTDSDNPDRSAQPLNQAELDQMLAPIALYPDTLLSHILVASTYPLEVVQAARWRDQNRDLDEDQALQAAELQDWDPSVKALAPFTDLLAKLSDDLSWLQNLGDAFLANEAQVLDTVQSLRHKAYASGNLQTNDYLAVARERDKIVIQNVVKEVVYVPYYDTRIVYGDWWWPSYQPIYWHSPSHYAYRSGFYWSPSYHISAGFFFGGFHWPNNYVVIDHHYRYRSNHHRLPTVRVNEYQRWQHNPHHRRGVRYTLNNPQRQQVRVREYQGNVDRRHTVHNKQPGVTIREGKALSQTQGQHELTRGDKSNVEGRNKAHNKQAVISARDGKSSSFAQGQHERTREIQVKGDRRDTMLNKQPALRAPDVNGSSPSQQVKQRLQQRQPAPGVKAAVTERHGQENVSRAVQPASVIPVYKERRTDDQLQRNTESREHSQPPKLVPQQTQRPVQEKHMNRQVSERNSHSRQQLHSRAANSPRVNQPRQSRAQHRQ